MDWNPLRWIFSCFAATFFIIAHTVPLGRAAFHAIDRKALVAKYSPSRNASSLTTPMQVGNGNFAFGADVTGLQTFEPFAILSSWGWKNDSFPPGVTLEDILNWHGTDLETHGRLVEYAFSPANDTVGNWLISNPNRVNLGRIGIAFLDDSGRLRTDVSESDLTHKAQSLDLWTGVITSSFTFQGSDVKVQTACGQSTDTIAVQVQSKLIGSGNLALFLDFPWNDGSQKFEAPFVGSFDNVSLHTTELIKNENNEAEIEHILDASTFYTAFSWQEAGSVSRDQTHRYTIRPAHSSGNEFSLSVTYSLTPGLSSPDLTSVVESSQNKWGTYWSTGGFVDLVSETHSPDAEELQRRIILSQYLLAVNEAGNFPPEESGLVNTGWYGKFHLEQVFWHMAHWSLWSKQELLVNATMVYDRFLTTSIQRAQVQQGYSSGARWGKESDASGRSAPGEINNLLIWQQPHPIIFAELEYRMAETPAEQTAVLRKWNTIVENTANFMAVYAWWNTSTGVYDLGPPMYPVSENTDPLQTINPTFELAYWQYGLSLAIEWWKRQGKPVNETWVHVQQNLAPLPTDGEGRYVIYEGLNATMWDDPNLTSDHPAFLGIYGWLPAVQGVNLTILRATVQEVYNTWNISDSYGWDFPLLALTAARLGDTQKAVEWLLHPLFQFDDVGMPIGGSRVPTPYFPSAGSLLYAIAMMAEGWDGAPEGINAPGFPRNWTVRAEGLRKAL